MATMTSTRMQDHFADLTDPRRREVKYPLINVVVIAVCAVIALGWEHSSETLQPGVEGQDEFHKKG